MMNILGRQSIKDKSVKENEKKKNSTGTQPNSAHRNSARDYFTSVNDNRQLFLEEKRGY